MSRSVRHHPPRQTETLIARPEAVAALAAGQDQLSLLIAPVGSGKTCLMASYYQQLVAAGRPVCWLNLNAEDNDPAVLALHLAQVFPALVEVSETPVQQEGRVVFLDGMEQLTQPDALALLDAFLVNVPTHGAILATSQGVHSALLHDARLRGVLRVIGPSILRMSDVEAARILGDQWSLQEVERLNRFVGGWAAGLRFLARAPGAARQQLKSTDGSVLHLPEMADYFADVLCARLPAADLQTLMELSVLNRFNATLLAALPDIHCDWEQIQRWVHSDLLLDYAGDTREWVVFHPAFGCYLRHRLCQGQASRHDALKQFAASWFEQQGFGAEAVRHAVGIKERPVAARIIENAGAIAVDAGDGPDVGLDDYLTAEQASEFPLLFLGQIYHRIRHGRIHDAWMVFNQARELTRGFTQLHEGADGQEVTGWANAIDVVACVTQDIPVTEQQINALEADLRIHLDNQPVLAAGIASVLAFVYLDLSRYVEAATICRLGLHAQEASSTNKATLFVRIHQAGAAIALDSIDKAVMCIEDAQRLARIEGDSASYEVLISQIMRGILHYENNELDDAWRVLWPALEQIHTINGWVRIYAEGFATAATVANMQEGLEAAEVVIRAGEAFARERDLPRLTCFMAIARLRERIRAGEYRDAKDWLENSLLQDLINEESLQPYVLVQQVPALLEVAQLMMALGRPRDALVWLDKINKDFLENADSRQRFSFRLLAMRAAQALRRYNAATEHMQAAVDLARQVGLIRRALDARHDLIEVHDSANQAGRPVFLRVRDWINDTLRHADGTESASNLEQNSPRQGANAVAGNFMLSPRESEIVALMAEGCINKEIARRLGISEGTVKTHRKKVHEKLGVSTRSQAIMRARELLII